MTSLILRVATLFIFAPVMLFSVFLLLRGHNEPGGGFAAGLAAAAAFSLVAIAYGADVARQSLRVDSQTLTGAGLLVAAGSGIWPLFRGEPFLTGRWVEIDLPGVGAVAIGSPLLFDVGVYLVVIGAVMTIILAYMEEE
jgi:multicomponent Na+:H+ antiporter subunit B